jgi:hypothetical protein
MPQGTDDLDDVVVEGADDDKDDVVEDKDDVVEGDGDEKTDDGDGEEGDGDDEDDDKEPPVKKETKPDAKTQRALELFEGLQDPEKARAILERIVAGSGLKLVEEKAADSNSDDWEEELKREFGEEASFLPDNFAKVIAKFIKSKLAAVDEIKQTVESKEKQAYAVKVNSALTWAKTKLPKFKENEAAILGKMKMFPYPNDGSVSMKRYIADMYTLATGLNVRAAAKTRIDKNKGEASPAFRGKGGRDAGNLNYKNISMDEFLSREYDRIMGE